MGRFFTLRAPPGHKKSSSHGVFYAPPEEKVTPHTHVYIYIYIYLLSGTSIKKRSTDAHKNNKKVIQASLLLLLYVCEKDHCEQGMARRKKRDEENIYKELVQSILCFWVFIYIIEGSCSGHQ